MFFFILHIIAIILSIIISIKNKLGFMVTFLSLFIGVFLFPFLLVIRPANRECPKCYKVINKKAVKCSFCQSDLEPLQEKSYKLNYILAGVYMIVLIISMSDFLKLINR